LAYFFLPFLDCVNFWTTVVAFGFICDVWGLDFRVDLIVAVFFVAVVDFSVVFIADCLVVDFAGVPVVDFNVDLIDADFFFEADAPVVDFNVDLIVVDFWGWVFDIADVLLDDICDDVGFVDFSVVDFNVDLLL